MDSPLFPNAPKLRREFDDVSQKQEIELVNEFQQSAGSPVQEKKEPEKPQFRFRPPELVPGGIQPAEYELAEDIVREELDTDAQRAIRDAHHRHEAEEKEFEGYALTPNELDYRREIRGVQEMAEAQSKYDIAQEAEQKAAHDVPELDFEKDNQPDAAPIGFAEENEQEFDRRMQERIMPRSRSHDFER